LNIYGSGRKKQINGKIRSLNLSNEDFHLLKALGEGHASKGVRILLDLFKAKFLADQLDKIRVTNSEINNMLQ